ncbi:hypothetical protein AAG570_008693 [Ranatra chinensis]|uniref:Purple acid phosphatase n=1 Tax=Ranatra chinensis TaxID=642074 RepID=A0ABD0YRL6_9HEMI
MSSVLNTRVPLFVSENVSEIVVTWSTWNETIYSIVEYGIDKFSHSAHGESKLFVDGGPEKRKQFIHRVRLTNLLPRQKYVYHCGSEFGWSEQYWFFTADSTVNWSPKLAVFGDMGNINARSLPYLQEEAQKHMYDAILHVGDLAYDMRDENGQVGDQFMRQIAPVAGYVPYMVCPGNHEEAFNFSHYRERFSMPGPHENLMYSFNLGPVHFISINTEAYYFVEYGLKLLVLQHMWLEKDLQEANLPKNRAERPWIITYGHRPMYCSDDDGDDCTRYSSRVRVGLPIFHWFGLEKLFYKYGVDLEIWAHEHSYERLWPVYNHEIKNGSYKEPYRNPKAPVHIISGSAGCQENTDPFIKNPQPWSAFRSSDYGYARLQIFNASHLYMEQVSVNKKGKVIDNMWLIKDKHGPYEE